MNRPIHHAAAIGLALFLFSGGLVLASDSPTEPSEHGERIGAEFKNEFVVFLGATSETGDATEFTVGLEYAREMGKHWGVGILADYAGGGLRNYVLAVPFYYYPAGRWKLLAAPGIEVHDGAGRTVHDGHPETDEDETHALLRLGFAYSFEVSKHYRIEPAVDVDFVKSDRVWVYGVNLNYAW